MRDRIREGRDTKRRKEQREGEREDVKSIDEIATISPRRFLYRHAAA